jgi:hypothetical protein
MSGQQIRTVVMMKKERREGRRQWGCIVSPKSDTLEPKSRDMCSVRTRYKRIRGIVTGVCKKTGDEAF